MKKLCKRTNKKGNVALESILAGGVLFMVFILIVGYFTYLYPRYMVDLEVQNLAHAVKMDGKLTESDFEGFIKNMELRGYTEDQVRAGTTVVASYGDDLTPGTVVNSKEDAADHLETLVDKGDYTARIVERNNGQIHIHVKVPANQSFLGVGLKWFGADLAEGMQNYNVARVVMSEAYLPEAVGVGGGF